MKIGLKEQARLKSELRDEFIAASGRGKYEGTARDYSQRLTEAHAYAEREIEAVVTFLETPCGYETGKDGRPDEKRPKFHPSAMHFDHLRELMADAARARATESTPPQRNLR